jgi:hypothetical protein
MHILNLLSSDPEAHESQIRQAQNRVSREYITTVECAGDIGEYPTQFLAKILKNQILDPLSIICMALKYLKTLHYETDSPGAQALLRQVTDVNFFLLPSKKKVYCGN